MGAPLIEAENLTIRYRTPRGPLTGVSNASFVIEEGEFFGFLGESGCGKTTLAKTIIGGLPDNGYVASGTLRYRGEEIQDYTEREWNEKIRWHEISYIPQSAMESLDPLQRMSEQAVEIGRVHTDLPEEALLDKFREMFEIVGLSSDRVTDYPHQFSGGMQQRAIISLALFLEPSLIIADEPTTALDVIMQDQVFRYLDDINGELGTSLLLITHDISLIFESCHRLAVMHSGQIAESGSAKDVYDSPRHPYTILLQEAIPDVRNPGQELQTIDGYPPELLGDVDYCTFVDRCPWAGDECREREPPQEPVGPSDGGVGPPLSHRVACLRAEEVHRDRQATPMNDD